MRKRGAAILVVTAMSFAGPAAGEPEPAATAQPPAAKREPSAGDLATARSALREGLALREKGEGAQALARLVTAYDLVQTPVTTFELGKTHMLLGHVLQAHELFKKVERMPPSLEESTRSQTARDEAARLARELAPRIPSLRIKLQLAAGASAVVKLDDDVIAMASAENVRAVDPGPHDVVAKAGDGPELKVHVEVAESETKDVALSPEWVPPKAPAPAAATQVVIVRQTNPLAFVGFGVGAASIAATAIGVYLWRDAVATAAERCGARYCPPAVGRGNGAVLPADAIADDRFQSMNTRAGIAFIFSLVAAISAVAFTGVGIIAASQPIKEKVVAKTKPTMVWQGTGMAGTF
jgi:hypothetical protein